MRDLVIFLFLLPFTLAAWDETPACYKALERDFFDVNTTMKSFDLYKVPSMQWHPIWNALHETQIGAAKIIKDKANKLHPSPLEHPFNPKQARQLLLDTMFEIFAQTMHDYYIYDDNAIKGMFEFIQTKKAHQLDACLGPALEKKKANNSLVR